MNLFSKKQSEGAPRRRQPRSLADAETQQFEGMTFRRGRTITGSLSSHIASVNETGADLKSPRVKAHELHQKRHRIGGLFLIVIVAAAGLYLLMSEFTAAVTVRIAGVNDPTDASYQAAIQTYLSEHPFERLRFMLNAAALNQYLQNKSPEVASVRSDGNTGFGASGISLVMRRPVVSWTMSGRLQYVDATGAAFSKNYYQTPAVQVVDNSGVPTGAGKAVASDRFLAFVGRTVGLTSAEGYTVTQVIIPGASTRQIELHLQEVTYPIKMSADRAVGEQVEDMARALRWFKAHAFTPQYVDVRVGGKAYYR